MSPEGRARVGAAARRHRPWERSTGPRTEAGKAKAARNGARGCEGPSLRELQAELAGVFALVNEMAATRRRLQ